VSLGTFSFSLGYLIVAAVFSLNDSWDKEMSCYVVTFGYGLQGISQIFLLYIDENHYNISEKKYEKDRKDKKKSGIKKMGEAENLFNSVL